MITKYPSVWIYYQILLQTYKLGYSFEIKNHSNKKKMTSLSEIRIKKGNSQNRIHSQNKWAGRWETFLRKSFAFSEDCSILGKKKNLG